MVHSGAQLCFAFCFVRGMHRCSFAHSSQHCLVSPQLTNQRASLPREAQSASPWSLDIYSFVFRDSAPKARYQDSLVHRIISKRPTVGFKRVWMRGVSEEHIRCDT